MNAYSLMHGGPRNVRFNLGLVLLVAAGVLACSTARSDAAWAGTPTTNSYGSGKLQLEIFEKTVEARLKNPTFITSYPTEVSPLSRKNDHNPDIVDRFELIIGGREIANAFSELNDPIDQRERFEAQLELGKRGDELTLTIPEGRRLEEVAALVAQQTPITATAFLSLTSAQKGAAVEALRCEYLKDPLGIDYHVGNSSNLKTVQDVVNFVSKNS